LVSRPLPADNGKQTNNMYQTIESLYVVLSFVGGIVFVCDPTVSKCSVMLCVDHPNVVKQGFILCFPAALGTIHPFVIAGSIQIQYVTNFSYGMTFFVHLLNAKI
jgi:hypothetical protein